MFQKVTYFVKGMFHSGVAIFLDIAVVGALALLSPPMLTIALSVAGWLCLRALIHGMFFYQSPQLKESPQPLSSARPSPPPTVHEQHESAVTSHPQILNNEWEDIEAAKRASLQVYEAHHSKSHLESVVPDNWVPSKEISFSKTHSLSDLKAFVEKPWFVGSEIKEDVKAACLSAVRYRPTSSLKDKGIDAPLCGFQMMMLSLEEMNSDEVLDFSEFIREHHDVFKQKFFAHDFLSVAPQAIMRSTLLLLDYGIFHFDDTQKILLKVIEGCHPDLHKVHDPLLRLKTFLQDMPKYYDMKKTTNNMLQRIYEHVCDKEQKAKLRSGNSF